MFSVYTQYCSLLIGISSNICRFKILGMLALKQACLAQRQGYSHTSGGNCELQRQGGAHNWLFLCEREGVIIQVTITRARDGSEQQHPATVEFSMGSTVNLRTARKQARRRLDEQEAAQNRLAHGRSKAEKALQRSQGDNARQILDQHRIERKDRP